MAGNRRRGVVLQPRDLHLLSELAVMRIIDHEMARAVGRFGALRRASWRLLALTRAGLLRRFFVGSTAHGRKAVYTLSPKGADVVAAKLGGINRPQGRTVLGDGFVEHQTSINEIYLDIKYRQLPSGARLLGWRTFREPIAQAVKLIPDGYFELASADTVRAMFLEVDLGTEALSVWQQKTASYVQLAVTGEFQKRFRHPQFRVLVAANSGRRLNNIRSTVATSTDKIFWFTTFDSIHRDGFWSPVWLRPTGNQPQSLV